MPVSNFQADTNDIEELRNEVINQYGQGIHTSGDCIRLQQQIEQVADRKIGLNTLRRFFNLLPATPPSKATLDILSEYCGFNGFVAFRDKRENTNLQVAASRFLTEVTEEGYINPKDFSKLVQTYAGDNGLYGFFRETVIMALALRDITFLKNIFTYTSIFRHKAATDKEFHFLALMLGKFLRLHKHIRNELIPQWAKSPIAQTYFFEHFVDTDFIVNYYHEYLTEYSKYKKTPEARLFVQSNLAYYEWLKEYPGHYPEAITYLSHTNEYEELHPIPVFRKFTGLLLYYYHQKETGLFSQTLSEAQHYVNELSSQEKQKETLCQTLHFLSFGLLVTMQYRLLIDMTEWIRQEAKPYTWYINSWTEQKNSLYHAIALLGVNEYKKALSVFKKVKPALLLGSYHGFDSMLLNLCEAKFCELELKSGDAYHYFKKAKTIAQERQYIVIYNWFDDFKNWPN